MTADMDMAGKLEEMVGRSIGYMAAVFAGVSMISVGSASAQTPTRSGDVEQRQQQRAGSEDYRPIGARIGSFQVFPRVALSEEHNDNVYAAATDEKSDFVTTFSPSIGVQSDFARHSLNLNAGAEIVRYADYGNDDHENYNISVGSGLEATRALNFDLSAAYRLDHEDRSSPDDAGGIEPTEYDRTDLAAGARYRPGVVLLGLRGERRSFNYDDVSTSGGTTNNDDRDRDEYRIIGEVGYEYLPDTDAFVRVTYETVSYEVEAAGDDGGLDRDSNGYEVVAGTDLDFTGVTTGEIFAGYFSRSYDDATLSDSNGVAFGGNVRWNVTQLTTIRGGVSRAVRETTTANSSGYVSTAFNVRVDHEFLRNLNGRAQISYSKDDYDGITREDDTVAASVGARYLINRNFNADLGYEHRERSSDSAGSDYTINRIRLVLTAQF